MTSTRSTTGCFACKTKRKKCDETKPHCLRCQKSRTECPGYTYIEYPNKPNRKLRTLPAPRTRVGQSRATADQKTSSANTKELSLQLQTRLPLAHDLATSEALYNVTGTSVDLGAQSEAIDTSNARASSPSFSGSLQHSSFGFNTSHRLAINTPNPDSIPALPSMGATTPMTRGQASLLEVSFSLDQRPNLDLPPQSAQPITELLSDSDAILIWVPPDTEGQDNITTYEDKYLEGTVGVICRQPVLDRTAESNALPFVLQSYARWVSRLALEPLKVTRTARDFVFSQFGDGDQSRWILALLANIGGGIGSVELVEARPNSMLSALQNAMRQRLGAVKSRPNLRIPELVKALDFALEV
ncbi:hypothetical protein B0J17DRAFT_661762 [Rhizoctonia solani]|nr:hypothetical protein B0J17DRAFT_661762 [Rhizoctonia solani]